MSRPIELKPGGPRYLKGRTPADLLPRVRGQFVTLPIGDDFAKVRVGEMVQVSLRTNQTKEAVLRHAVALAALKRFWEAHRVGPTRLTQRQQIALAGTFYRLTIAEHEDDPGDESGWLDKEVAALVSRVSRFDPGRRLTIPSVDEVSPQEKRLEQLYGSAADDLLGKDGLVVDQASRSGLIRQIGKAFEQAARQLRQYAEGDYTPDPDAVRFPIFVPAAKPKRLTTAVTVDELAERWAKAKAGVLAANTIKRYAPSHRSFAEFTKGRAIDEISDDDVFGWARHRRDHDKIAPKTVNQNDLVAVSSLFAWAKDREGGKLVSTNPAEGVMIEQPPAKPKREKAFREEETKAILRAASSVTPCAKNPSMAAAKRWCPWLCAYSGARISEVTAMKGSDVRIEAGIPVMMITQSKTNQLLTVPIHSHLVEQGFVEFAKTMGNEPLFYDLGKRKSGSTTPPSEIRSRKLAEWIREAVTLDMDVRPNHGWRHTFKTKALESGMDIRVSDAITGHSGGPAGRGYEFKSIRLLHRELELFPRYKV